MGFWNRESPRPAAEPIKPTPTAPAPVSISHTGLPPAIRAAPRSDPLKANDDEPVILGKSKVATPNRIYLVKEVAEVLGIQEGDSVLYVLENDKVVIKRAPKIKPKGGR